MALEPAGVSLQAEGFSDYIKKLDQIEKTQREVFEAKYKETGKSYAEVTRLAKQYEKELDDLAKSEARAAEQARKLAEAQKKEAEAVKRAADEARKAGKAQISGGIKDIFSGDIKSGVSGISAGLKAIGPAATAATAGIAAVALGAGAAAVAIGGIGIAAVNIASKTQQATNQIASSLGITGAQAAEKYGDALNNIFVNNPEAEFTDIANAIALTERALDLDTAGIEQVAADALNISQVFGEDVQKTIGATQQLIEQFGLTGQQATDLVAFGLQNIPADDLIDSIGEYSNQFAQAGFTAEEFFSLLSTGAAGGVLGTDKAGDALKEFQIRFLEGNKTLKDSFGTLGLSFDSLTAQVNSGQADIADVFGAVIDRIGEVDLNIASNRAAVAGLGTQFEDLGAAAIAALDPNAIRFADVEGAAGKLGERFNTIGAAFESIKRSALVSLAPIGQAILEFTNSIVPKIRAAFEATKPAIDAFSARVVPAFQFGAEALGRLGQALGGASGAASTFEAILNGVASVIEGVAGGIEILARVTTTFNQTFAFAKAGAAAFGSIISDVFNTALNSIGTLGKAFQKLLNLDFGGAVSEIGNIEIFDFGASLDKAGKAAIESFQNSIATDPVKVPVEVDIPETVTSGDNLAKPFVAQTDAIKTTVQNLDSYKNAIQQAQELNRSFAREAEDNAIKQARAIEDLALKQARANEDVARRETQQVNKLQQSQVKERDKLLKDQQKQLDKFETDRKKQIAQAEKEIATERRNAAEERKRSQEKLQRELQQAQERFNLSQLQSERRFKLQEKRLIAEGDILALQQLREDEALRQQEEKENFDLDKKEQIASAQEQQKEQAKDLDNRIKELKANLDNQRAELLKSFDEQLAAQQESQAEQKAQLLLGFQEEAAERALQRQREEEDRQIALQREEEDRRLSQQRQIEELGRSFAEQEGITQEGTQAVANELEKVFGIGGAADSIMTGFTEKTENEFTDLFKNLEDIVAKASEIKPPKIDVPIEPVTTSRSASSGGFGGRIGGVQEFQEGGVVQGPLGSPQPAIVHAGETVLPTHRQAFTMAAPVVPSQNLNVDGNINVNGSGFGQANEEVVQEAMREMTENFRIAIGRLARRN